VSVFVAVVGDSFWRPSLLFVSISVVATFCLSLGLLRCLGWFEGACPSSCVFFPFLIDVCTTAILVVCFTYYVLDSGGPITFASRSGVGVELLSCLAGYNVSLVDWGLGVLIWFGLEVWWADHFWFEIRS